MTRIRRQSTAESRSSSQQASKRAPVRYAASPLPPPPSSFPMARSKEDFSSDGSADSSDEGDLRETEEDRNFIDDGEASDSGVENDGNASQDSASSSEFVSDAREASASLRTHSQKHEKRPSTTIEDDDGSDLDEEDLELVAENAGTNRREYRRLQNRSGAESANKRSRIALEQLFDEEETSSVEAAAAAAKPRRIDDLMSAAHDGFSSDEGARHAESPDDDLDDFIVYESKDEERAAHRPQRLPHASHAPSKSAASSSDVQRGLGISSNAWQDILSIFGDGSDYAYAMEAPAPAATTDETRRAPASMIERLAEAFEPALLSERMMTSHDEAVKHTDVPERMQLRAKPVTKPAVADELQHEAVWISGAVLRRQPQRPASDAEYVRLLIKAIFGVLTLLREEFFEVPFIATHRKELCHGVLNLDDLWLIYDLDEKWACFYDKKQTLQTSIASQSPLSHAEEAAFLTQLLDEAVSEEDLASIEEYVKFVTETMDGGKKNTAASPKGPFKAPDDAIQAFCSSFFLRSWQIGRNIRQAESAFVPDDPEQTPDEAAAAAAPESPEFVVEAAVDWLACELSFNPSFRKYLSAIVPVYLTIEPTERGRREIDRLHEFYPFKYVTDKPIDDFDVVAGEPQKYLEILKAEKAGLINVQLSAVLADDFLPELFAFVCSSNNYLTSDSWNLLRQKVLLTAFEVHISPLIKKRARERLFEWASEWMFNHCKCALQEKLMVTPIALTAGIAVDQNNEEDDFTVMAASVGAGDAKAPLSVVILDRFGRVVVSSLFNTRSDYAAAVASLFDEHRPVAVAVSGGTFSTKRVYEQLCNVAGGTPVFYVEDDAAKIYSISGIQDENARLSSITRYAVSAGRRMICPLYEFANLCNAKNEIALLPLHPLQSLIPDDLRRRSLERAFVNVVNLVGLDINLCTISNHPTAYNCLQFVCGLGLRKAHHIKSKLTSGSGIFVEKRNDILAKEIVTKRVFMNCASFLRVSTSFIATKSPIYDCLDVSRIHPESYFIARKMAANALDMEEIPEDETDYNRSVQVAEVMEEPEKLNELDLEGFAAELEKQHGVLKHITLQDIRAEIQAPFKVSSFVNFVGASEDAVFTMLTGESDGTLFAGLVVSCTVSKVMEGRAVFTRLDSGISGVISFRNVPSDTQIVPNDTLNAKVLSVSKEKLSVELSLLTEDLSGDDDGAAKPLDRYFDHTKEAHEKDAMQQKAKARQQQMSMNRAVAHPAFRNFSRLQAEAWLAEHGKQGDFLVRPSSMGLDHLTITVKIFEHDPLFMHLDVREQDKPMPNALGKTLFVGDERFGNIDEIANRVIYPLMDFIAEVQDSPKYVDAYDDTGVLAARLQEEKTADPSRIPYGIAPSKQAAGKFVFAFIPGTRTVRREFISVHSKGFKFKGTCFENLGDLVNWFKKNYSKL